MSKFTFFYGGPFSQWYRCQFKLEDIEFNCAEQFMMYKKAVFFEDKETAKSILAALHPRDQKEEVMLWLLILSIVKCVVGGFVSRKKMSHFDRMYAYGDKSDCNLTWANIYFILLMTFMSVGVAVFVYILHLMGWA